MSLEINLVMVWLIFLTINRYQRPKNEKVNSWCGYSKLELEYVVTISVPKIMESLHVILILDPKK